jgi:hypothetical protein
MMKGGKKKDIPQRHSNLNTAQETHERTMHFLNTTNSCNNCSVYILSLQFISSIHSKGFHVQWYLGLQVTWFASVLQDDQKFLINFNFIHEQCLAIRVLCLPSITYSQAARVVGNRLTCSVSVGIPHSYSQHSC